MNVYLVKNKFNGKGYVGITTVNINWRIAGHLKAVEKGSILQYDLGGNFIAYHATTYAAATSIGKKSPSAIIACCKGRISFAQGYIWKYATVDEVV